MGQHLGTQRVTIKNISGGVLTVRGIRLQDNEEYKVPSAERDLWDDDPKFGALVDSGDLEIVSNTIGRFWKRSNGNSSTTSTNWQQKLRLNAQVPEDGKYRIGYTAAITNTVNNETTSCRIQVDDSSPNIDLYKAKGKDVSDVSGFSYQVLTSGTHTIDLDYKTTSGGTAQISRARLEYWVASVLDEEI